MGKNFVEPATRAFSCLAKASVRVRRARQARRAERAGRRASSLLEDARRPGLSRRRKPTDAHGGFRGRAGRRKALMKQPFHLLKAPHAKISLCFQGYGLHWHLKTGDIPDWSGGRALARVGTCCARWVAFACSPPFARSRLKAEPLSSLASLLLPPYRPCCGVLPTANGQSIAGGGEAGCRE